MEMEASQVFWIGVAKGVTEPISTMMKISTIAIWAYIIITRLLSFLLDRPELKKK
jgi:hypothetical protein